MQNKTSYTLPPLYIADASNAGFTGDSVDTNGYDFAKFTFGCGGSGTVEATDVDVQDSDDESTWTDITNATGKACGAGITSTVEGYVDLRGRGRYLRCQATISGTGSFEAHFDLSRGDNPVTAAAHGASGYFAV